MNGHGNQVSSGGAPAGELARSGAEVGRALAADRLAEATREAAAECGAIDEDCIDFEDALAAAGDDGEA